MLRERDQEPRRVRAVDHAGFRDVAQLSNGRHVYRADRTE